ncbi:hypothetical protein OEZ86_006640 [Tetradesmus obliquus]|nr:hypothetical protein OEZ86_006640 [Tetradesmus obliquus]
MTAGAFQDEMQQALDAALHLLADVEAQIRSALGLDASSSIYDANPEQLQSLPPAVLETLESTLQKLSDKKLAAEAAHAQAMRDVWQLTGALQVLATADEQCADYLAAVKQSLQHGGT